MAETMLSTPQKVLRDTLRERIDSSSSKDASSHPDVDDDDDNNNKSNNNNSSNNNHVDESSTDEDDDRGMEMRREALRQRGRESYAKRKESSTVGTNTTPAITRGSRRTGASESFMDRINAISNDDDDDDDDDGEDIFFNESRSKLRPDSETKPPQLRKKRKPDAGNGESAYLPPDDGDGSETEEDEPYLEPEPGSGKRKASASQRPPMDSSPPLPMRPASPPRTKATRVNSGSTTGTVVSRFKEGSMRNRASVVPPVEIIGKLPSSSSPPRPDNMSNGIGGESNVFSFGGSATEKPGAEAMAAASASNNEGSFTFGGISSLIPNPFKFVKGIKQSWDRQKRFHEEREQQKKELRERKIKGMLAYEELKRMGAMQGYAGNAAAVMGAQGRAKNSASSLGPIRVEHDQIGRAFSTDQQSSPLSRNTTKVRRKQRTTRTPSVGGDVNMAGMAQSFCEGRESYVDENGTLQRYSVDSKYMSPQESLNRRSMSKPITPKTAGAMGPPPPIPTSRANGRDFEDARILPKKKSSVFSVFGGRSEDSKEIQKLKRQEQLQKKVSNLEDQLERARRELEVTIEKQSSHRKRIPPINGTAASRASVMSARESAMSPSMMSDETDEGDKTEVDEDHAAPLSPLVNASSIGGSFMAKTAGMTIVEKPDVQAQQEGELALPDVPIPKKAPKSGLGGRRRVISSSAAGSSSASATAAALKHQGSMPAISKVRKGSSKVEAIPPVPKFTNGV